VILEPDPLEDRPLRPEIGGDFAAPEAALATMVTQPVPFTVIAHRSQSLLLCCYRFIIVDYVAMGTG
jgi:hypothetical protein